MNLIHDYVYENDSGKRIYPQIYIYSDKNHPAWVKIGYTTRKNPEDRVKEQYGTLLQLDSKPYVMIHVTEAVRYNGVSFTDNTLHNLLKKYTKIPKRGEFYQTDDLYKISKLILDIKNDINNFDGIRPICKAEDLQYQAPQKPKIKSSTMKAIKKRPV